MPAPARVAILLSTFNGARFLRPQLHSLLGQTHRDWVLYWRDDGSTDDTVPLMRRFLATLSPGQGVALEEAERVGLTESFLRLLRAATRDGVPYAAFADQDDVWLPEKLARAVAALETVSPQRCALYFARQMLVDADLRRIAISFPLHRPPGFPTALTQNVATGCTVVLNRAAMVTIAGSRAPAACLHDWWSYLVVAAGGGALLADQEPVVLYRQHRGNTVGAPSSLFRRGIAALRRGPAAFMNIFRQNVAALLDQPALLTPAAEAELRAVAAALRGGRLARLRVLANPNLRRQTGAETLVFLLWFLLAPLDETRL
ncbi:MAG: glycosyltransferase [Rhodospirillales bacterium]|nr:glycosyltransferase [Rhodospirillales bacterium]